MYITYHYNKDFDPVEPRSRILKDIHYYIYDEKEHDTFFVQHAFKLQWLFMKERGFFLKCGLMGVLVSSKVQNLGFLCQGIIMKQFAENSQVDAR
jgi:hypothetical protein